MKSRYEADALDIDFLRTTLLPPNPQLQALPFQSIVNVFEKFIEYMEEKEIAEFLKKKKFCQIVRKKNSGFPTANEIWREKLPLYFLRDTEHELFSLPNQSLIFDFWRKKQNYFKRPMVRKHWKLLHIPRHNFGSQDLRKLSFAPRKLERKQTRFKDRFLRKDNAHALMLQLLKESKDLMELIRLVTFREKVKYELVLFEFSSRPWNVMKKAAHVDVVLDKVNEHLDFIESENLNCVCPFEGGKTEALSFQDRLMFMCNLVEELDGLGFELDDFLSHDAPITSQTLKQIKSKMLNGKDDENEDSYFVKSKYIIIKKKFFNFAYVFIIITKPKFLIFKEEAP
jgi:hypothetical protein